MTKEISVFHNLKIDGEPGEPTESFYWITVLTKSAAIRPLRSGSDKLINCLWIQIKQLSKTGGDSGGERNSRLKPGENLLCHE